MAVGTEFDFMKSRKCIVLTALVVIAVSVVVSGLLRRPNDPLFHGKPESVWIEHLVYRDEEQVKQWRGFGPDGVLVLIRALEGAIRPSDRAYRQAYRGMGRILPDGLRRSLPTPKRDLTRSTRMTVVDLLSRLSKDAIIAMPIMVRSLSDEDHAVRQIALTYFTEGEDEHVLLNRLEAGAKAELLPVFIRAMQDDNLGIRNNASIALGYYPEQSQIVVPVLEKALQDPVPLVRKVAADALRRIDPAAAANAGVERIIGGSTRAH
jgi:HEAT repeat protein